MTAHQLVQLRCRFAPVHSLQRATTTTYIYLTGSSLVGTVEFMQNGLSLMIAVKNQGNLNQFINIVPSTNSAAGVFSSHA